MLPTLRKRLLKLRFMQNVKADLRRRTLSYLRTVSRQKLLPKEP